jgi:prepilin-type N-terminal cleavage/methylation domain-containing protein
VRAPGRRPRRGLTFVELLVAVSIIAIVGVGLASHLRGALMVWRRSQIQAEQSQRLRVTWQRLSRDLANAVLADPPDATDSSTDLSTAALTFATVLPPRTPSDPPRLARVSYELQPSENRADASDTTFDLVRTVETSVPSASGEAPRGVVLLRGLASMSIEYPIRSDELAGEGEAGWVFAEEPWPSDQLLPRVVRITLVPAGPGDEESRAWRWVASIPHGTIPEATAE